nr:mitotic checkpoint protein BUB3.1 [Tanacetum cinerariifolium]
MEFFDLSEAGQSKKYIFKCHRKSEGERDIVYPVNIIAFHPTAKNSPTEPKEDGISPAIIGKEFVAMMASGTIRTNEATTVATKKVPLSMKELAKKELKLLEAQYPSGYQYLKLQLKEFIHVLEEQEQEKEDEQAFIRKQ